MFVERTIIIIIIIMVQYWFTYKLLNFETIKIDHNISNFKHAVYIKIFINLKKSKLILFCIFVYHKSHRKYCIWHYKYKNFKN